MYFVCLVGCRFIVNSSRLSQTSNKTNAGRDESRPYVERTRAEAGSSHYADTKELIRAPQAPLRVPTGPRGREGIDTRSASSAEGPYDMTGGITSPISRLLSERRSHRHQWQSIELVAIVVLDAALVYVAFLLAYLLRYHILFNNNSLLHTLRRNLS